MMLRMIFCTLLLAACVAIPADPPAVDEKNAAHDPEAFTLDFVGSAVEYYRTYGLEKTVVYFSSSESVRDQWYVFIIGEDGYTIAHPEPASIGRDPNERVDPTGYFYGDDILSADEEGKWVHYVRRSPETGGLHQKHTWVIRYDGLIFGSGWYEEEEIEVEESSG